MSKMISKKVKKEAVNAYVNSNETLREVAAKHGLCAETLRKLVGPKKIRPRGTKIQSDVRPVVQMKTNTRWSAKDLRSLKSMVKEGKSNQEIGGILGRTPNAISWIKTYLNKPKPVKVNHKKVQVAEKVQIVRSVRENTQMQTIKFEDGVRVSVSILKTGTQIEIR